MPLPFIFGAAGAANVAGGGSIRLSGYPEICGSDKVCKTCKEYCKHTQNLKWKSGGKDCFYQCSSSYRASTMPGGGGSPGFIAPTTFNASAAEQATPEQIENEIARSQEAQGPNTTKIILYTALGLGFLVGAIVVVRAIKNRGKK